MINHKQQGMFGLYHVRSSDIYIWRDKLAEVYAATKSSRETGKHFGVSYRCALDALARFGLQINPAGRQKGWRKC